MFVKPSASTPSALRKAAWEKAQAERNTAAQAAVIASVKPKGVSLVKTPVRKGVSLAKPPQKG